MENRNEQVFHTVEGEEGLRLDVLLTTRLDGITRSFVRKLIEEGKVLVDGKNVKCGHKLKIGSDIRVDIPKPESCYIKAQKIPIDIVFEDRDIIVVNKHKGMVVHPAAGNREGTLVNALLSYCSDTLSDINGVIRPGIVHRIDKDTTGLLVVAKNNAAHLVLSEMMKKHEIVRTYEAIADGVLKEDSGRIDAPVGRHPKNRKKMAVNRVRGREAVTHYSVVKRFRSNTWVRLVLETGRTHQIRVHMAAIGHPLTGDAVYGKKCGMMDTQGQVLHARYLDFIHPITHENLHFKTDLPEYFKALLNILENR